MKINIVDRYLLLRDNAIKPRDLEVVAWQRPTCEHIKVNWMLLLTMPLGKEWPGMGIVARDHVGRVVAALCASRPYILDSTTADALAAWGVDEFCTTLGHFKFILEGYSPEVVQAQRKESCC
jgi:hypothetical protein